eukprot:TRINITY_DN6009_c0_g1_i1.p1 TRINITY_DN6009_c0_g1~~TRINITY_DN6009_c0_g1_i1.p1  ORF type:complete len:182 (-),score=32.18 TRINITY_DN6009_c0_g1_i1:18-563(-)
MDATGERKNEWVIGIQVRIKTTLGEEVEGEIFSYDATTSTVVLQQTLVHSTLKKNFVILKTNFIKEIEYLGKEKSSDDLQSLPPVNIARIKSKASTVLRNLREEAARIGVGVTEQAQDIFNALSKTLPCRWKQDSIIVMDEVTIRPPYASSDCSGDNRATLERVKKVLEGERRRIISSGSK